MVKISLVLIGALFAVNGSNGARQTSSDLVTVGVLSVEIVGSQFFLSNLRRLVRSDGRRRAFIRVALFNSIQFNSINI